MKLLCIINALVTYRNIWRRSRHALLSNLVYCKYCNNVIRYTILNRQVRQIHMIIFFLKQKFTLHGRICCNIRLKRWFISFLRHRNTQKPRGPNTNHFRHFAYWTLRLLRGQFAHLMWTQENGGGGLGPHLTQTRLGWGLPPYCMPSFIVIRPTVWPQYTNGTDRTDRQRTDSIGRTVLQTVAQKTRLPNLC